MLAFSSAIFMRRQLKVRAALENAMFYRHRLPWNARVAFCPFIES